MHLSPILITHSNHDYVATLKGTLPHDGYKIVYLCGTWNGYRFEIKLEVKEIKKSSASSPFPFQEKVPLGPLRQGQYCIVVNQNEQWAKWFGVD
jgi:phosphatidate phosphatase PAH1